MMFDQDVGERNSCLHFTLKESRLSSNQAFSILPLRWFTIALSPSNIIVNIIFIWVWQVSLFFYWLEHQINTRTMSYFFIKSAVLIRTYKLLKILDLFWCTRTVCCFHLAIFIVIELKFITDLFPNCFFSKCIHNYNLVKGVNLFQLYYGHPHELFKGA